MRRTAVACGVLGAVLLGSAAPAEAQKDPGAVHVKDYRTCKTCGAALEKAMGYLKKNLEKTISGYWYAEFLNSYYGGFAFLMDGNSQKEAKMCADKIAKYFDPWVKNDMGYTGWFCSMAMFYLTEYSLRYGLTPEIAAKLQYGAKWCHKTREKEGGWFHSPRWGFPNYALDISSVGCAYFAALTEMKALGLDPGPALEEAREYVDKVCDGRSVAYGLWGRGGGSYGASAYILLGLTASGRGNDPLVAGIGKNLSDKYRDLRHGHACGILHHFVTAAALHRVGPEAYGRFAEYYLHQRLIPSQHDDGSIGGFPCDDGDPSDLKSYQKMKTNPGDFADTAALAGMILLERPGAFNAIPPKKTGTMSNKEAWRLAQEALGKNDLGKAYKYLAQVLPMGDSEELVPKAQAEIRRIEEVLSQRLKEVREREKQDIPKAKELEAAKDYKGAAEAYDGVIQAWEAIGREFAGLPLLPDVKAIVEPLRKAAFNARIRS